MSNINQYKISRLNAEISAFSNGDLNKYEFLTRKDLKYKPNALDKARFEFSPLGKAFSTGLDKNVQGYQEEGVIKLLKDIRDSLAGNVIIPARPPRPNDNGNDNGDDNRNDDGDDNGNDAGDDNGNDDGDDNGNDNGNDDGNDDGDDRDDKKSFIDLSWINNLQLYKKIASEVFSRYNGDKDSFELFTLQTFIDNINNERFKNKKDAREEFKNVKKNVKSEALKQIVKKLEQAIFGDDDNDDNNYDEDLLEAEELDRRMKNLISKKHLESLREYLKESEDVNPQDRVNALRKKLNNLPKTSSDETSDETSYDNNDNNDNNDSEDNQISNFVDRVRKKVSKEIVNHDNKNNDNKNDDNKKLLKLSKKNVDLKKMKASKNLSNKQVRDAKKTLELSKKYSELNAKSIAKTYKQIEEIIAKNKAKEEVVKMLMKYLKNITQKKHKEHLKK